MGRLPLDVEESFPRALGCCDDPRENISSGCELLPSQLFASNLSAGNTVRFRKIPSRKRTGKHQTAVLPFN